MKELDDGNLFLWIEYDTTLILDEYLKQNQANLLKFMSWGSRARVMRYVDVPHPPLLGSVQIHQSACLLIFEYWNPCLY